MATFRKTGEKPKYSFLDVSCIGRTCWHPGNFQHRGATSGGSRSTGNSSFQCLNRAYRGCPENKDVDISLIKERELEGWKSVR